jgi:hypothetical protein
MQELGVGVWPVFIGQPIPFFGEFTNTLIFYPREAVELTTSGALDELGSKSPVRKAITIPQYNTTPIFSRIVFILCS